MTLEALGNVGELLGGLAVVVSLLYLAFELRANTRTARAAAAAQSQDSLASINDLLASEADLAKLVASAAERGSLEGLAPEEAFRLNMLLRANLQRFESMYFLYEAGLLEERVWAVRRYWMAGFLKTPMVAEWWNVERDSSCFTPDFIAELESVVGLSLDPLGQRPA